MMGPSTRLESNWLTVPLEPLSHTTSGVWCGGERGIGAVEVVASAGPVVAALSASPLDWFADVRSTRAGGIGVVARRVRGQGGGLASWQRHDWEGPKAEAAATHSGMEGVGAALTLTTSRVPAWIATSLG